MKGLTWIFCLAHVDVRGNELADTFVGQNEIQGRLDMEKEDIVMAVLVKFITDTLEISLR